MSAPSLPSLLVSHWDLNWSLCAQALICCACYVVATRRVRGGWPPLRTASFMAGVGAVIVALCSGLETYDDKLLSAHMVQHMILLLLAPLLLLGGHPAMLVARALPPRHRPRFARAIARTRSLTGPIQCLAVFWAVLLLTHLPVFYDAALRHTAIHDLEHVAYLLAGSIIWWPLCGGEPVQSRRLSGLGRLVYTIVAMPPMALIGAYLNRHATLAYPSYEHGAHVFGVSALVDQQSAGAIMWVAGNVIMAAVGLWAAVAALLAEERRQQLSDNRAAGGALT